jgi:N-acyl-D-aspartate/D-glutamate deacylase
MDATNDGLMNGYTWRIAVAPGVLGHNELIEGLERAVSRHPKTIFVASHICNLDYDLGRLGQMFDGAHRNLRRRRCRKRSAGRMAYAGSGLPVSGSTVLTQLLPQWALEGGIQGLLRGLADPARRAHIAAGTEAALAQGWHGIIVASVATQRNQRQVGRTVAEIALDRGRTPVETALDLLVEE